MWPVVLVLGAGAAITVVLAAVGLNTAAPPRPSLLEASYFAAGVLLALVGMLAVLQLWLTESHERARNRRESVDLTLKQCAVFQTELQPRLEVLRSGYEAYSARTGLGWPPADEGVSPVFVRSFVEDLLRASMTKKWLKERREEAQLEWDQKLLIGKPKPAHPPELSVTDEEKQEHVEAKIPTRMSWFAEQMGLTFHDVNQGFDVYRLLKELDVFAAYLLHGECDLDLARSLVGEEYMRQVKALAPVVAFHRPTLNAGTFASIVDLFDYWRSAAIE